LEDPWWGCDLFSIRYWVHWYGGATIWINRNDGLKWQCLLATLTLWNRINWSMLLMTAITQ